MRPDAATLQTAAEAATLRAAAEYVASYERHASGLVAEESYQQTATGYGIRSRYLRSDLVSRVDDRLGWVEFRDVFEVDGQPVRDRDDRLATLLSIDGSDAVAQVRAIARESARFNLDVARMPPVYRTVNLPRSALAYLRGANQSRSRFSFAGSEVLEARQVAVFRFEEKQKPRLVAVDGAQGASGRFWIEPLSGRVLKTELNIVSRDKTSSVKVSVRVMYADRPSVAAWVPVLMEETYKLSMLGPVQEREGQLDRDEIEGTIDGTATYSNFRRFSVSVSQK
jgi:hypothetical protein